MDDHGDALFGYAMLRLRDVDSASEVVQETFLEALKGQSKFLGQSTERTWLIGILKHKIVDLFRRKNRRGRTLGRLDDSGVVEGEFFDERGSWKITLRGWAEEADLPVEREEFWEVFRACLADLPSHHAAAFTLVELEGMTGSEACKILEITPTNLWARLHRARLQLRRALEERWFGRDPG